MKKIAVIVLLACPGLACAFDAAALAPPAGSPEATVVEHYRLTGVPADLRLALVTTAAQRDVLAILAAGDGQSPCRNSPHVAGQALSEKECAQIRRTENAGEATPASALGLALRASGFNDRTVGSWVLEDAALTADARAKALALEARRLFGADNDRLFSAAHELGHATLRAIAESGRLRRELPDSYPVLHNDLVFKEAFCDLLAVQAMAALQSRASAPELARSVSAFRRRISELAPDDAGEMAEVADLLAGYARALERGAAPASTIAGQITQAAGFLGQSGVFDSMLGGARGWQRIREEGCVNCFSRRPYRVAE